MKKLLFALFLLPLFVQAQIDPSSYKNIINTTYGGAGQMVNIANSYFGLAPAPGATTPYIKNGFKDGPYLDTASNTTPLFLYIAKPGIPITSVDTLTPLAVQGNGTISFNVIAVNVSGTTAGKLTIQQSITGLPGSYGNVEPSNTADTMTISAAGVYNFNFRDKFAPFYRVAYVPTGTQKTTLQAYWYFIKPYSFSNN